MSGSGSKDYMVEKNRKLKEQFAAAAGAGSTGVFTEFSRGHWFYIACSNRLQIV